MNLTTSVTWLTRDLNNKNERKMKSYFYGKDPKTLYDQKAVRVRKTKTCTLVEYIYKFNWTEEIKKKHPEWSDYCVKCLGKNAKNVPFKAGAIEEGKKEGHWWFQYGPNLDTVNYYIDNPAAIYDLTNKEHI